MLQFELSSILFVYNRLINMKKGETFIQNIVLPSSDGNGQLSIKSREYLRVARYMYSLRPSSLLLGTKTSKSLTVHSEVTPVGLTYISVPTLIESHARFAGFVPGSCTRLKRTIKRRRFARSIASNHGHMHSYSQSWNSCWLADQNRGSRRKEHQFKAIWFIDRTRT